ncbi:MAG: VTT domain-containing protein [Pseudomonadota bacterium]
MRRFIPLIVIVILAGVTIFFDLHRWLAPQTLLAYRTELLALVEDHTFLSALAFVALYTVVVATSLPGALALSLISGFLFGIVLGSLLNVIAATSGAVILFIILRYANVEKLTQKAGGWVARLRDGFARNAFFYLLFLRLLPVAPFFAVNVVAPLLGMRLLPFTLATAIGILPGTIIYTTIGTGFDQALVAALSGGQLLDMLETHHLLAFGGLALLSLAPPLLKALNAKRKPKT